MNDSLPDLPSSVLREWSENQDFVVAGGKVYVLFSSLKGRRDTLRMGASHFGLEYAGDVRERFDEAYVKRYGQTLQELLEKRMSDAVGQQGRQVEEPLTVSRDLDVVSMIVGEVIPRYHHPRLQPEGVGEEPTPQAPPLDAIEYGLRGSAHPLEAQDFLVFRGRGSRLRRGALKDRTQGLYVNGRGYYIKAATFDLERLIDHYESELANSFSTLAEEQAAGFVSRVLATDEEMLSHAQAGQYEDQRGVGFEQRGEAFYVYARIPSFALYEVKNDSYYQFRSVRVAVPLYRENGEVKWHKPVVMERCTHPLLPAVDRGDQSICLGPAQENYKRMRAKLRTEPQQLPVQVAYMLREGVRLITESYRGNQDTGVYMALYKNQSVYEPLRVDAPYNVTNV